MRWAPICGLVFFIATAPCLAQSSGLAQSSASASVVVAQPPSDPTQPATQHQPKLSIIRALDESIRKKLDEPIDCNYNETPWSEIELQLEKRHRFNIVLTSSAKDDSLTDDEPLTEVLTGIPLRNALRIMLRKKNATYVVKDGVMQIISLDDHEDLKWFSIVFINVRPLLAKITSLEKARIGQPRTTAEPETNNTEAKARELVTAESLLTDLIYSTYETDQWRSGQGLATIKIIGGFAVVNCNEELAAGLREFLTDLDFHLAQE